MAEQTKSATGSPTSPAKNPTKSASWRRDPTLPFQRMDEDTIVVDPRSREVHLLNETAARIWELLETASSVDELCEALGEEYEGAPAEALRQEVEAFVEDLGGKGLLLPRGQA